MSIQTELTGNDIERLFQKYQEAVEDREKLLMEISTLIIDVDYFKNDKKNPILYRSTYLGSFKSFISFS